MSVVIKPANHADAGTVVRLVGELLQEIMEITTPPLPLCHCTSEFYQKQGFAFTGGL